LEAATFTVFRAGNNPAEKPLISHPNPNYGLTPFPELWPDPVCGLTPFPFGELSAKL
jgi:hypothetical protein